VYARIVLEEVPMLDLLSIAATAAFFAAAVALVRACERLEEEE
jgi:hypothetical protein